MFRNAHLTVNGGTFTQVNGDYYINNHDSPQARRQEGNSTDSP